MPPSDLLCLLLAAARLLAPAGRAHAQGDLFPTPASTNVSTSWVINLKAGGHGAQQSFGYMDGMSVSVFLLQSVQAPPQGGLSFAACFYCAAPCADFYFGVCILQVDSGGFLSWPNAGTLQVVWSANRDRAVRENATLSFTAGGDLLLRDTDGSLVWSTRTSDQSVAGMILTKSGNLVLFDRKNAPVWESFSHPADCLLPGQQLVEGSEWLKSTALRFSPRVPCAKLDACRAARAPPPPVPSASHSASRAACGVDFLIFFYLLLAAGRWVSLSGVACCQLLKAGRALGELPFGGIGTGHSMPPARAPVVTQHWNLVKLTSGAALWLAHLPVGAAGCYLV